MPDNKAHSKHTKELYGVLASDLHRWIDSPRYIVAGKHRSFRHTIAILDNNPTGHARFNYKPNEEEKKNLCNSTEFQTCPRFRAFINHLKAASKESR